MAAKVHKIFGITQQRSKFFCGKKIQKRAKISITFVH